MSRNFILTFTTLFAAVLTVPAQAQNELTGDTKLSCEAVLCLATGTQPGECAPSLNRYFSISSKRPEETIQKRTAFLNQCPASSQSAEMQSLVAVTIGGAGNCDIAALNSSMRATGVDQFGQQYSYISNQMPSYCTAYTTHAFTNFAGTVPLYVGKPERGGYWVDPQNYEVALAQYNARVAAEDEAARRNYFQSQMGN